MADEAYIWTRRDDETSRSFECFCVYRDLGPSRSLAEAYRQETGKKQARQPSGTWTGWYAANDWKKRAEAYDAFLEESVRKEREAEYLRKLEAYRKRQQDMAIKVATSAMNLLEKTNKRLGEMEAEDITPEKLPAYYRAVAAIADSASNAEATALGVHELIYLLDARDSDQDA